MLEEQNIVKNKKKMLIAITITMALLLVVGISYALWQTTKVQEGTNYIASGCFGVEFVGNNPINLENSFPITSEEGMKLQPYTFTITNTCNGKAAYDVNLEALSATTIQNRSVRVALEDINKLYSEYQEAEKYYEDSVESRKLISGRLEANESVTYNLRIWVDESVTLEEQDKVFKSKIVVSASEDFDDPKITDINTTSTTDTINISYNANGDISTTCKYGLAEGTYENEVLDATTTECNIKGLKDNTTYYYQICTETKKGSKCEVGNVKTQIPPLSEKAKVGDYIRMTPTSTSYTIPTSLTGYSSNQTINPSELNLWRVIRKNEDGTIDVVSEYVSSIGVYFRGDTGYMNFVGTLKTIAAQYTNDKYVLKTRHMGYNNQIEFCTSFSLSTCPADTGYEYDLNLVHNVLGSLVKKNIEGNVSEYWLASRDYYYSAGVKYYYGSCINSNGTYSGKYLRAGQGEHSFSNSILPILTLKSDIMIINGDGKSANTAYGLE